MNDIGLFTGNSNSELAKAIAEQMAVPIGKMSVSKFADGEVWVQVNESVRGIDAFIVQSGCCPYRARRCHR